MKRIVGGFLAVAVSLPALGRGEEADVSPLRASILCEAPPAPGRFRCDVEARVSHGTLSWGDVVVVKTDDFILPLRGRVGPRDASARESDILRWSLGFVAKSRGSGDVTVRVRVVVCHEGTCDPYDSDVAGRVIIGR